MIIPFDLSVFNHITAEQLASVLNPDPVHEIKFKEVWLKLNEEARRTLLPLIVQNPTLERMLTSETLQIPTMMDDPYSIVAKLATMFTMGMAVGAVLVMNYPAPKKEKVH